MTQSEETPLTKRTTIRDIAAHTGMSTTAVSLVLNNKPCKISKASRDKIVAAARELNYTPNQLAVGLITRRTRTLGIVVSDISNSFYSMLTKGAEEVLRQEGWSVVLCNSGDSHARDLECIEVMAKRGVEGLIYCMSPVTTKVQAQACYELLERLHLPYVMVDSDYAPPAGYQVSLDNRQGGYLATRHLIEQGHTRIACITGPNSGSTRVGRVEGYCQALQQAGLPLREELLVQGNYTLQSGVQAVADLAGRDYTALFACNDMMAFGALKALREAGVQVPGQVSLVGYDDVPMGELMEVPLTTVRQPVCEMGERAAQMMMDLLEQRGCVPAEALFEPRLIVRKSVGPAPK